MTSSWPPTTPWSVTCFVFFSLWIALSPMGSIVLAKNDDEEAEFGLFSWFAMLFAAGMGIGLVYWGVAEPLSHYSSPPPGTADNGASAARNASDVTLLHWGLHAWAIYVVVGLAIAYATHRKGRPISIRYASVSSRSAGACPTSASSRRPARRCWSA